ncbi:MAG: tyrosine--tRNA ligase [bacterium]
MPPSLSVEEQIQVLRPGVEEILSEEELRAKIERSLKTGRPLRVKQGFDPTAPDIHLGHTVGLRILRRFQSLGHRIVLIVGDYTALVGDPSGRSVTRPRLSREQILANAKTYQDQFFKILDRDQTEVRFNGEWFAEMRFSDVLELCARFTVARLLERDDFQKRFRENVPISLHELLYPVMQGYDSVVIQADVEIGATEQKFNLLAARGLQKDHDQEPQVALTFPVLPGLDGVRRMSKSIGNYVGVAEPPEQMYGKLMSIPDDLTGVYVAQLAQWSPDETAEALRGLARGEDPMGWKSRLAEHLVSVYHGAQAAEGARAHFDRVVRRKEEPEDVAEQRVVAWAPTLWLPRLLKECGLAPSTSEARRLIASGGVMVDGEKVTREETELPGTDGAAYRLKVGKRRFLRIVIEGPRA